MWNINFSCLAAKRERERESKRAAERERRETKTNDKLFCFALQVGEGRAA